MKKKLQIGIIGLGKFGLRVGTVLSEMGHDVIGIDSKEDKVKNAQYILSQVYQMDAANKDALEQIRIQDLQYVIVSVGDSIAVSIMVAMYLKELEVEKVLVKAIHADHEKLLRKIGVDEVIIPEYMAANQTANKIAMPGIVEHLPFDREMALKEFKVDKWSGKTLREVDVTNKLGVQIIATRKKDEQHYKFIPKAGDVLEEGGNFVAIGHMDDLLSVDP